MVYRYRTWKLTNLLGKKTFKCTNVNEKNNTRNNLKKKKGEINMDLRTNF